jgi:hypothetical protein
MPRSWLLRAFRNLLRRDRIDKDLDEEVRSYLNLLADEKTASSAESVGR